MAMAMVKEFMKSVTTNGHKQQTTNESFFLSISSMVMFSTNAVKGNTSGPILLLKWSSVLVLRIDEISERGKFASIGGERKLIQGQRRNNHHRTIDHTDKS